MKVTIQNDDVRDLATDVLALKYAQNLYGADLLVFDMLKSNGIDLTDSMPGISESRLVNTQGTIPAKTVLFLGLRPIDSFGYRDIKNFARDALKILKDKAPGTKRLALTLHGIGFGLDESLALEAEIQGFFDAIQNEEYPKALEQITIVELDSDRVERLNVQLSKLVPDGALIAPDETADSDRKSSALLFDAINFIDGIHKITANNCISADLDSCQNGDMIQFLSQAADLFSQQESGFSQSFQESYCQKTLEMLEQIQLELKDVIKKMAIEIPTESEESLSFVLNFLIPIQVKVEVAKHMLSDCGKGEIGQYTYAIVVGVLVVIFNQLGLDTNVLDEKLGSLLKEMQMQLLNEIALKLIPDNKFPWHQVPDFLSMEGTDNLLELHNSAFSD